MDLVTNYTQEKVIDIYITFQFHFFFSKTTERKRVYFQYKKMVLSYYSLLLFFSIFNA